MLPRLVYQYLNVRLREYLRAGRTLCAEVAHAGTEEYEYSVAHAEGHLRAKEDLACVSTEDTFISSRRTSSK